MRYLFAIFFFTLFTYSQNQNLSSVSFDNRHIAYRGVNTPVKISVKDAKAFTAAAPGLKKIDDNGNYWLSVTNIPGDSVDIKIDITLNNGKHKTEIQHCIIKDLARPSIDYGLGICTIGSCISLSEEEYEKVEFSMFLNLDIEKIDIPKVTSFDISFPDKTSYIIEGEKFTPDIIEKIKALPDGSIFKINLNYYFPGIEGYHLRAIYMYIVKNSYIVHGNTLKQGIKIYPENKNIYKNSINKITIEVPDVKSYTATAPGLTKIDSTHYNLDTRQTNKDSLDVVLNIVDENDSTYNYARKLFLAEKVNLKSTLNREGCNKCIIEMKRNELINARVEVWQQEPERKDELLTVSSYTILAGKKKYTITGNIIPHDLFVELPVKKGEIITVTKIKYRRNSKIKSMPEAPDIRILIQD